MYITIHKYEMLRQNAGGNFINNGSIDFRKIPGLISIHLLKYENSDGIGYLAAHYIWSDRSFFRKFMDSSEFSDWNARVVSDELSQRMIEGYEVIHGDLLQSNVDEFPVILRKLRLEYRLTMSELGRLIGVTPACVCKWESGATPSAANLVKLASVFEVTRAELLGGNSKSGNRIGTTAEQSTSDQLRLMIAKETRRSALRRRRLKKIDSIA